MGVTFPGESPEYRTARDDLLAREIELRRAMEAVAVARRALPPGGLVPQDYLFEALDPDGKPAKVRLSELFAPGKDTLVTYNYMFPRYPTDTRPKAAHGATADLPADQGPCPSCTALVDQLAAAAKHVEAAGVNFVVIANAPLDLLVAFAKDRGWTDLRLVSSGGTSFKQDYNAADDQGRQLPLTTVFHRGPDGVRHFWTSEMAFAPCDPGQDSRDNGTIEPLWTLLDLTPGGRPDFQEQLDYPCCKTATPPLGH